MDEKCLIICSRPDVVSYADEFCECLRPKGHHGPHLVHVRCQDRFVAWETDLTCNCGECQSEDTDDWCILYDEVSEEDARKLIASGEAI